MFYLPQLLVQFYTVMFSEVSNSALHHFRNRLCHTSVCFISKNIDYTQKAYASAVAYRSSDFHHISPWLKMVF